MDPMEINFQKSSTYCFMAAGRGNYFAQSGSRGLLPHRSIPCISHARLREKAPVTTGVPISQDRDLCARTATKLHIHDRAYATLLELVDKYNTQGAR